MPAGAEGGDGSVGGAGGSGSVLDLPVLTQCCDLCDQQRGKRRQRALEERARKQEEYVDSGLRGAPMHQMDGWMGYRGEMTDMTG